MNPEETETIMDQVKITYYIQPTIDLIPKECPSCNQKITNSTNPIYLRISLNLEPHIGDPHVHVHLETYHVRCIVNKLGWYHVPSIAWSENFLYLLIKPTEQVMNDEVQENNPPHQRR